MPKRAAAVLGLLLSAALHLDWHLARPAHHRLSLEWPDHWMATAVLFGIVGCLIARTWPATRWRLGAVVFVAAILVAQGIEPLLEVLLYQGRFGYAGEPARWAAFGQAIAAATPVYWGTIWLCVRRPTALPAA